MFEKDALKELLARGDVSNRDKVLMCLAVNPAQARTVGEVKAIAVEAGLRAIAKWNVSAQLSKAKTLVIRTPAGWELTAPGKAHVLQVAGPMLPSVTVLVLAGLRKQLATISKPETQSFVGEAVGCLEARLYRSAIVTSWVGAVAVLYDEVVQKHLAAFNTEALRRDSKWKAATTPDDLTRMTEYDFLQVVAAIGIVGKNVKNELEVCLKLRNGCGHPNSLVVGEHKASAHVETLIQNVFAKFL